MKSQHQLRYHQATFDLTGRTPQFSPSAVEWLERRERECGIRFPASVQEWYSLDGAVDMLYEYSNQDQPVSIDRLCAPENDWLQAGTHDADGRLTRLIVMHENQGVCQWAVLLDGSDDPSVEVAVDSPTWQFHADRFSTFVYTCAWDWGPTGIDPSCSLAAQDRPLASEDLAWLQAQFEEGPRTYSWPGKTNYRFWYRDRRILIWDDEQGQADWWLWAWSEPSLAELARQVWSRGSLADTLYDLGPCGENVLSRLRA